eukprot:CAMPEP_0202897580 /NCGR_PEP_ID=MMETSP1392-20130828/6303_1 /ASSEMBLY_ACC=CAM_ASM_000868 /TAXON_ID=225041 /ORGANISM="Chlamydomonas chlamydogama, Strain SAG 11-48b" /LENGTH=281 /DNA_ID=CAMNT_0049583263 /DNA_START=99 /DNA_END=944 /DNA_ORIENTATION=-
MICKYAKGTQAGIVSIEPQILNVASTSRSFRSIHRSRVFQPSCAASTSIAQSTDVEPSVALPRRALLASLLTASAAGALLPAQPALASGSAEAGTYLPPADKEGFVIFVPDKAKTPALRAGTIRSPYSFNLPATFREAKVSNTASGNFCQPRCGEPWTEVIFEDVKLGRIELLVSPLVKLTNRVDVGLKDLGSPEALLPRIGTYITGTYFDEEDVVSSSVREVDGLAYYYYELYAPGANGHSLTALTVKGECAYLFIASGSDKVWGRGQSQLRTAVDSFRA